MANIENIEVDYRRGVHYMKAMIDGEIVEKDISHHVFEAYWNSETLDEDIEIAEYVFDDYINKKK